jgi:pyridoxal phosphate enzyme (YggS family)
VTDAASRLAANLFTLRQEMQRCAVLAGRDPNAIRLIAVSKTRTLQEVTAVAALGQICFGENTIQDAMSKIPFIDATAVEWHFIGHLQSKKAVKIPGHFQWIHSVDSIKLAKKLSSAMQSYSTSARLNCLIQVNVSAEKSKFGLPLAEVKPFLAEVLQLQLPGLNWRGLMTIGVKGDEQQTRNAFAQLRQCLESCSADFGLQDFDQLSMGMSNDYCLAILEGATMIRVGTSIFGERKYIA